MLTAGAVPTSLDGMSGITLGNSSLGKSAVDRVLSYFNDRRNEAQGVMPERRPAKQRSVGATVYPSKR